MLGQMGVDLAKLYSETTDFDLVVSSTYDSPLSDLSHFAYSTRSLTCTFNISVFGISSKVSGTV